LARRIRAELTAGAYDLIFVHCSSVAPYVAEAHGPLKVLDYGDMDSQKWREYSAQRSLPLSAGYWLEAVKLERVEKQLAGKFDFCTCTTRAELETLRGFGVGGPTGWFPNGVDCDFFAPGGERYDENLITFVGRMDYYPNQQGVRFFCRDVLPLLRQRQPEVRFEVVGADPPPSIRKLAALPGVTVTGSVPDVRPFVRRAALTVAPLEIARGTQNKILESMAMGVPVVCSEQAAGGVDAIPGEHILVARTPQEYVAAIVSILQSPQARGTLAAKGRARVLTNHTWASSMRQLDTLLTEAQTGKGHGNG
jgi:sugar transferase (PEP-CTERM/EpsH1 system associated)